MKRTSIKKKTIIHSMIGQQLKTGVDIIEISRIQDIIERRGDRFLKRIFTEEEIRFSKNKIERFAGRFAAKEAVMKAFGTGRIGISWTDIEVIRTEDKAPEIKLHGRGKVFAKSEEINDISISISHSKKYAVAFAVIVFRAKSN